VRPPPLAGVQAATGLPGSVYGLSASLLLMLGVAVPSASFMAAVSHLCAIPFAAAAILGCGWSVNCCTGVRALDASSRAQSISTWLSCNKSLPTSGAERRHHSAKLSTSQQAPSRLSASCLASSSSISLELARSAEAAECGRGLQGAGYSRGAGRRAEASALVGRRAGEEWPLHPAPLMADAGRREGGRAGGDERGGGAGGGGRGLETVRAQRGGGGVHGGAL